MYEVKEKTLQIIMKKNENLSRKTTFSLKSACLVLCLFGYGGSATYAESFDNAAKTTLTVHMNGRSVKDVFSYIEENSDFIFVYQADIDLEREVNVNMTNVRVEDILQQLFDGTDLEYTIDNRHIKVSKADPEEILTTSPPGRSKKIISVSGRVEDMQGEPLMGAAIIVKGDANTGIVSDMDGNFTLEVPYATTIVISYVGYKNKTIKVYSQQLLIRLEEDMETLNEVVVTALGLRREEKALGYAVQKVDGKSLTMVKPVNIATSLTGKVAGLNIQNSTEFDTAPTIKLRGETPLIVIDGVPYANVSLNDVAPEDIESIEVLKGATASALYGARGGTGAIMVTTRRGKNDGLEISISDNTMFNAGYLSMPKVQSSYSSGNHGVYSDNSSYVWGAKLDIGNEAMQYNPYTYEREMTELTSRGKHNLENFQQLSLITSNNINVTYKGQNGSFRTSLTHVFNEGQFPNEVLNKINYTVAGDLKFGKFSSEAGITYNRHFYPNMSDPSYGSMSYLYELVVWSGPEYDIRDYRNYWRVKDQESNWWDTGGWYENPYYIANEVTSSNTYDVVNAFVNASYDFTPWLKFSLRSGVDMYSSRSESKVPIGSNVGEGSMKGYYGVSHQTGFSTNNDFLLMANKSFNGFTIDGFVGGTIYYWQSENLASNTAGGLIVPGYYSLNASVDPAETSKSYSSKQTNSLYGKVGISYKSMAFVEVTGRNDWSSTLPAATRSYFYPSVSGSVILSEIFKLPSCFSFWKLRGSWTTTKNDMSVYEINNTYTITTDMWDGMSGASVSPTLRNSVLSPSQTRSYELGTAIHLFKDRLLMDYAYYNTLKFNNTRTAVLSAASGYTGTQINMDEEQMRKGMEITLSGDIIRKKDLTWSAMFNWARDRYIYYKIDPVYSTQKPWVAAGERWDWISANDYQRDSEGNIIHGSDGMPLQNPFASIIGYSEPNWTWGLNTTLTWKGFTINIGIDGSVGGTGYNMVNQAMWNSGSHIDSDNKYRYEEVVNGNKTFIGSGVKLVSGTAEWDSDGNVLSDNRVFAPNDIVVSYQDYIQSINPSAGTEHVQNYFDKTFIKLRELSVSYALPRSICQKAKIRGASIGFVGQNLLMWSKAFHFMDPEYANEALASPSIRYMGFNVKLDF